ncbi:MAG: YfhO family protein [Acutalibacteraceae bacterium]
MFKKLKEKANTNPLIKNFYNNRFSWLALACTVFIMMIVYYCYDLFPFGDTTILRMDLYHQYGPLFAELYERITNLDSLIYSWTSGGGSPFLGNLFNYLSSPTVLIMLLLGHKNMPEAIAGMILVKAAAASFIFSYFLSKKHKIQSPLVSAFGVLYACSGYFIAYYWNIMWLDAFYIFPLVILGIEKLISERKSKLYTIALAFTLITNYYMGYMVCIFSVLYFIYYYFVNYEFNETYFHNIQKRQKGFKNFFTWGYNSLRNSKFFDSGFRFAFCSLGAALLSAFVLLPIYYILINCSATSGTWPEEFKTYFSIFDFLANHLASLDPTIRSSGEDVLPNVYCGILTVMLVPLYIFSNKISAKEKVLSVGILGFMFASFYTNYLNFIWHGFHFPNDLPYRFSYMYSFLLLIFAFKAIINIKEYTNRQIIGVGAATTFFIILVQEIGSKNFTETGVWVCITFIGIYCLALGILKNDRYPAIAAAALILCSVCAEYTVANTNNYSMNQTKDSFAGDYDDFQVIKDQIDEYNGNENYRMELTSLRARMDPCWYNYNGMSTFTSMAYEKVANMQSDLGMFSNYINSYTYNRQTPIYNAFFALDYIVDNQQGSKAEMNPTYYNKLFTTGKYTAYENLYQLPIAFRVNEEIIEWSHDDSNPFEIQSELFGNATGYHNVFNDIKVTDVSGFAADCTDLSLSEDGYFPFAAEDSIGAALTFTLQVKDSGNAYVYFKTATNNVDNITFTLSDGTVISQNIDTKPYIMDLGYLEAGETVQLYAPVEKGDNGTVYLYAVTLNDEVFSKGYEQLKAESLQVTDFKETEIKGTVNVDEDGILFTSINYDTGWSVYIDGVKLSNDDIISIGNGALLGVNITKGEHQVTFKYTQNGMLIGSCISILTLIIFILLCAVIKTGLFEFNPPLQSEEDGDNSIISDEEMNEIVQNIIENKNIFESDTNE